MRVRASEIYKRNAHTSLRCVGEIPLCPRNISRELQMISANILFFLFFFRLTEFSRSVIFSSIFGLVYSASRMHDSFIYLKCNFR